MDSTYRFGIEEEIFLADAVSRGTPQSSVVDVFHNEAHMLLPSVERELLEAQVEISSPPSTSFAETRQTLAALRKDLATIGQNHGLLLLASGTHPLARWSRQSHTKKERYEGIAHRHSNEAAI